MGLGGGCYWCTEAVFKSLLGVSNVEPGFICSQPPYDVPSEAVLIDFDTHQIRLIDLIEIHIRTHASSSAHSMREKYRSAIYAFNASQFRDCEHCLASLQDKFNYKLVTRILPFAGFERSEERYQNYYAKNSGNQFCHRYIDPKLDILRREYTHLSAEKVIA